MAIIIDSHCHINDELLIGDTDNIIIRMKENGVERVLIPGWDIKSSIDSINLSNKYKEFYSLIGVHPENIDNLDDDYILKIEELIKSPKVLGIGEIGLDYHYTKENMIKQKEVLLKQLDLAYKYNLPISIHMRDATKDFYDLIKDYINKHGRREKMGVMHSFSGSLETMNEFIKLGFYISFSGPVTFKNAVKEKECARLCPLDRILVETDSPYLTPVPFRGKINEPKNVFYILKYIAELKNIEIDYLKENIYNNFNYLFSLEE